MILVTHDQVQQCDHTCIVSHDLLTATIFNNVNQHINVYGDDVEVDYRGYEVGHIIDAILVYSSIIVDGGKLYQSIDRSVSCISHCSAVHSWTRSIGSVCPKIQTLTD